jgi:hypothetical protein
MERAAESIGISGTALAYRMDKLNIPRPGRGNGGTKKYTGAETEFECTTCRRILPASEFNKETYVTSLRPVAYFCKDCSTHVRRRRIYNLTNSQYLELLQAQSNRCSICCKTEEEVKLNGGQPFMVDHCHISGRTRSLLCDDCNTGLGYVHEDVSKLNKLIAYLAKPESEIICKRTATVERGLKIPAVIDPLSDDLVQVFIAGATIKQLVAPTGCKWKELIPILKPHTKERTWARSIHRNYGLTLAQFKQLHDTQNGCCAVCGEAFKATKKFNHLLVEHNHVTGKFRGLVCYHCNLALSKFHEDPVIIKAAIKYLEIQCV